MLTVGLTLERPNPVKITLQLAYHKCPVCGSLCRCDQYFERDHCTHHDSYDPKSAYCPPPDLWASYFKCGTYKHRFFQLAGLECPHGGFREKSKTYGI